MLQKTLSIFSRDPAKKYARTLKQLKNQVANFSAEIDYSDYACFGSASLNRECHIRSGMNPFPCFHPSHNTITKREWDSFSEHTLSALQTSGLNLLGSEIFFLEVMQSDNKKAIIQITDAMIIEIVAYLSMPEALILENPSHHRAVGESLIDEFHLSDRSVLRGYRLLHGELLQYLSEFEDYLRIEPTAI